MIETLVKMSGTTHESRVDQKTITKDNERLINKNEGKISYTMATKERPVIQFNDFMFIEERNSIIIKAGSSPIWNKRETAYPMSFRLFKDTIKLPGRKFSLQTIPTNSSAKDFDVRKNQPDFFDMLKQRIKQAKEADKIKMLYLEAYGLTETDILRLDQNVVSDDIMHAINGLLYGTKHRTVEDITDEEKGMQYDDLGESLLDSAEDNTELIQEVAISSAILDDKELKRYAGGYISRYDLSPTKGQSSRQLEKVLTLAYAESKSYFDGVGYRVTEDGELLSAENVLYIKSSTGKNKADVDELEQAEESPDTRVYGEDGSNDTFYEVTDAFIEHLVSLDSWLDVAGGRFEKYAKEAYIKLMT